MTELYSVDLTIMNFRDHPFPDGSAHGFRWVNPESIRFPHGSRDADFLTAAIACQCGNAK
ncbi:hypothetical protein ACWENS_34495 [Streptomyces sp. NPDC004532]